MARAKRSKKNNNPIGKIIIVLLVLVLIAGAGFGVYKFIKRGNNNKKEMTEQEKELTGNVYELEQKALIAYFSRTGNTLTIASLISRKTESDMFKIQPVETYSYDATEANKRAEKEKKDNARPEIETKIENIDDYDVIFLGYPVWCDTVPMIINTFLDTYNLDGKVIIPFAINSDGGFEDSIEAIEKAEPNATVLNGVVVSGSEVGSESTRTIVDNWLSTLKDQIGDYLKED